MPDQPAGESGDQDQDDSQSEEKYKVVVDGEEHEVALDELIGGYQRQADYTNKTQELSSEKERYEALVEQKATELYLKALEDGEGKTSPETKNLPPEEKIQSELQQLKEKLESSEKRFEDREADAQLDKLLGDMRTKYPDMDEEKVLIRFHNEAKEHDDPTAVFENLAKESSENYGAMRKKIIDEYIEKKSVSPFEAGETGGSTAPTTKSQKPVTTFEEARERAEARLRAIRGD